MPNEESRFIEFLNGIDHLDLDIALINDYIGCFKSDLMKLEILDEIEALYEELGFLLKGEEKTEGVNSRIKTIHRRSSGRAGMFLLNAYMVLSG